MFMNEVNCSSEQVEKWFFNPNLENLMVQNDPSAGEKIIVKELIGRIGNSSQISRVKTDLRFATTNLEFGKLSRVSSNQSITSTPENAESRENSSITAKEIGPNDANCRKRKAIPQGKPKPISSSNLIFLHFNDSRFLWLHFYLLINCRFHQKIVNQVQKEASQIDILNVELIDIC
ncbi:BHLH domain-containing protein [Abeliophyllum distichum]|uniref:BHLH domain-containing protein n=1 Tax=Abeliophyllum distichum TaxID=126358 RepID=A0ABD1SET5_9LAMI